MSGDGWVFDFVGGERRWVLRDPDGVERWRGKYRNDVVIDRRYEGDWRDSGEKPVSVEVSHFGDRYVAVLTEAAREAW